MMESKGGARGSETRTPGWRGERTGRDEGRARDGGRDPARGTEASERRVGVLGPATSSPRPRARALARSRSTYLHGCTVACLIFSLLPLPLLLGFSLLFRARRRRRRRALAENADFKDFRCRNPLLSQHFRWPGCASPHSRSKSVLNSGWEIPQSEEGKRPSRARGKQHTTLVAARSIEGRTSRNRRGA